MIWTMIYDYEMFVFKIIYVHCLMTCAQVQYMLESPGSSILAPTLIAFAKCKE